MSRPRGPRGDGDVGVPGTGDRHRGVVRAAWKGDPVYGDLARPMLSEPALRRALVDGRGLWREVRVLATTPSTNGVVAEAARAGAPEGLVVVAESQTAGRGRLGREWVSPPRAGVTVSVLLRPAVRDTAEWGWLPLLTGLAVVSALRARAGLPEASVKWPNDVLVGGDKVAGVLVEVAAPGAAVVGLGLNVTTTAAELPADRPASSLALEGATTTDRDTVLRAVLRELELTYERWHVDPERLRADYRAACSTLGRAVRMTLSDGSSGAGVAEGVDDAGRLQVRDSGGGLTAYSSGDVVHLR